MCSSDLNGTGSEEQPYLTIAKALTMAGGAGGSIILHKGTYTENVTVNNQNLDIVGANRSGATLTGTVTFTNPASSVRVYGVSFTNTVTHSGAGSVYIVNFTGSGSFVKSGNGYLEFGAGIADTASLSITGAGQVTANSTRFGAVTVNNAAAVVSLQNFSSSAITLTNGLLGAIGGTVFSTTESGNAITSAAGTNLYLRSTSLSTPLGAVARMAISGNLSLNDAAFDRANSTLGTNLGTGVGRFDALDTVGPLYANGNSGTTGYVLQSNGSGSAPSWVSVAQAQSVWTNLSTLTLASTTPTTLLSVSAASFRAVFINLSVSDTTGGKYHTDSYQINHDGTTANVQSFAGAHIGVAPYSLSAAITAGNLVISVTSTNTNSTKYVGSYQTFAI